MKIIATNKNAKRNYEILKTFEAGIKLEGWEVKSARASNVELKNAYCSIYKDEVFLKESYFKKYMLLKVEETKNRKLLLHKKEILKIKQELQKNLSLIPTKIYFNSNSLIKVELALGRGLKKYDKREKLKKEEVEKKIKKILKF
ncbi:SsrA-binding protein [Mycoplasmopsis synoviae]|uniref:SsrA-binding protein n=1 Tax=Mycoplasmopsis synoviae TaxID=2109 RepID=UPI000CA3852B|nr:SsrA-binding protein [Mycoplasmopsis synoviae]AKJ20701.1 tmRNA-binding protein SmpB [Mycoplasmopsis synoviae]AQU48024.1 tmRNA-binding protein SmpB [Mycoplasmopsis synoviae]AWL84261.1 SsrA-binding protein [Mycoplasmopsis synoviae]QLE13981.1 SsrA-binding protein [Mycoplasmopsis synoviae]UZF64111.1 SsrA-binding protein [Mycoplasmopsis synoviae]